MAVADVPEHPPQRDRGLPGVRRPGDGVQAACVQQVPAQQFRRRDPVADEGGEAELPEWSRGCWGRRGGLCRPWHVRVAVGLVEGVHGVRAVALVVVVGAEGEDCHAAADPRPG